MKKNVRKIILLFFVILLTFCRDEKKAVIKIPPAVQQFTQQEAYKSDYQKQLKEKIDLSLKELQNCISDLTCSEDSHCGLLQLDYYSPCGSKNMFYSSATVSMSKLDEMVKSHSRLTQEYTNLYLMGYACTAEYIPPRVPLCISNVCKDSSEYYLYLRNTAFDPSSAKCTNSTSCKVLTLSAKDCGNYTKTYLIYSTESVNEADLLSSSSYYERIIAKGARPEHSLQCSSTTSPPAVSCVSGVCK